MYVLEVCYAVLFLKQEAAKMSLKSKKSYVAQKQPGEVFYEKRCS